jgi:hypothetical protein
MDYEADYVDYSHDFIYTLIGLLIMILIYVWASGGFSPNKNRKD